MILKYSNLPAWQKVLFFPFWIVGWGIKLVWIVLAGLAALAGTILGQGFRLLAILFYFLWMWSFIGWLEGQGMAAKGEADRKKALQAELDKAREKGRAEALAEQNRQEV